MFAETLAASVVAGMVTGLGGLLVFVKKTYAKNDINLMLNAAAGIMLAAAFFSLMEPARVELEEAIKAAPFAQPICPVYQNVDAKPYTDPEKIQKNLIAQLTSPVRWTQIVRNMLADQATLFTELGPGSVLQGLIKKVDRSAVCESKQTL